MPDPRRPPNRRPLARPAAPVSRRAFLGGAVALGAGAVLAGACSSGDPAASSRDPAAPSSDPAASTAVPPATATDGPARFVDRGPTSTPRVALTFHTNGDLALAQRILDIAEAHQAPITCFVVGDWLEANPSWGAKLRDAGHELANHTYSHPDFTTLSPTAMVAEIKRCRDVLRRHAGDGGRFFRPSGTDDGTVDPGPAIATAAGESGYPLVAGFDVDPFDFRDPGAAAVRTRTLDAVGPGSVVSLHFGHAGTVTALPDILDGLATKGLTPVTLTDLLG